MHAHQCCGEGTLRCITHTCGNLSDWQPRVMQQGFGVLQAALSHVLHGRFAGFVEETCMQPRHRTACNTGQVGDLKWMGQMLVDECINSR